MAEKNEYQKRQAEVRDAGLDVLKTLDAQTRELTLAIAKLDDAGTRYLVARQLIKTIAFYGARLDPIGAKGLIALSQDEFNDFFNSQAPEIQKAVLEAQAKAEADAKTQGTVAT